VSQSGFLESFSLSAGAIGFGLGALLAAVAASVVAKRQFKRLRRAEQRARAAERMAELGAMTGGLAHEIKNPLSTIGLNTQLLAEAIRDLDVDEDDKSSLLRRTGTLSREVDRLRDILTDFLEYAGEIRLHRSRCDLNEVVAELVDFYHPQAENEGVRLRSDPAPHPLLASLDASHVKQALLNLMLNAVQAMTRDRDADSSRRELILRTRRHVDEDRREFVVVHVTDTGPGMDAETLNRVFEPYFTTRSGGSGLGLPTSRRLIEQHGGRLEVHSEPGRGTDFAVFLPVGEAPD
jgi:signal transduction histidine kinase